KPGRPYVRRFELLPFRPPSPTVEHFRRSKTLNDPCVFSRLIPNRRRSSPSHGTTQRVVDRALLPAAATHEWRQRGPGRGPLGGREMDRHRTHPNFICPGLLLTVVATAACGGPNPPPATGPSEGRAERGAATTTERTDRTEAIFSPDP